MFYFVVTIDPGQPTVLNVTVLSHTAPTLVWTQWEPPTKFDHRIDKYILKWEDPNNRKKEVSFTVDGTLHQVILI